MQVENIFKSKEPWPRAGEEKDTRAHGGSWAAGGEAERQQGRAVGDLECPVSLPRVGTVYPLWPLPQHASFPRAVATGTELTHRWLNSVLRGGHPVLALATADRV